MTPGRRKTQKTLKTRRARKMPQRAPMTPALTLSLMSPPAPDIDPDEVEEPNADWDNDGLTNLQAFIGSTPTTPTAMAMG